MEELPRAECGYYGGGQDANTALQEGLENPDDQNTVAQSCIQGGHRTVRLRSHHNVKGSQRG